MGIRFLCPNGHKLNVKADLAGKRASCPNCGAKLVVPLANPDTSAGSLSGIVLDESVTVPAHKPEGNGAGPPSPRASAATTTEKLLTPRSAAWYVRPVGGGQFGPAADDVFCAWIAEGRVSADANVWRDGWPEWKLVRDVADLLPMPLAATPVIGTPAATAATTVVTAPIAVAPPPDEPVVSASPQPQPLVPAVAEAVVSDAVVTDLSALAASGYLAKRRRGKKTQLTLAIVMLLAVVVLAAVLIWVVRRNAGPVVQTLQSDETHESEAM
jgi:hypothetical protein